MTNYFASDEIFYRQCFYRRKLFSSDKVFQVTIVEQSILNLLSFLPHLRNGSGTIKAFKQKILPFIHRLENSILKIFNPERLKLVTPLRLDFSQLNEHHFGHNFQEFLNSLCTCRLETKNTSYYLLHYHHNTAFCTDLTNSVKAFVVVYVSPYQIGKKLKFSDMEPLGEMIIKIILYYQLL